MCPPWLDRGRLTALVSLTLVAFLVVGGPASSAQTSNSGTFVDDDGNIHEESIESLAGEGIARGCNPPVNDRFCPNEVVTRGEMAAFLDRSLSLPAPTEDHFNDDNTSIFEEEINTIAAAGVTRGCNPPDNTRFCPEEGITRGEMATLLVRSVSDLVPDAAPRCIHRRHSQCS